MGPEHDDRPTDEVSGIPEAATEGMSGAAESPGSQVPRSGDDAPRPPMSDAELGAWIGGVAGALLGGARRGLPGMVLGAMGGAGAGWLCGPALARALRAEPADAALDATPGATDADASDMPAQP